MGATGTACAAIEHMFFAEERLPIVQDMITAGDEGAPRHRTSRPTAHGSDFEGIFRAMDGYPVIIRLLDPASA